MAVGHVVRSKSGLLTARSVAPPQATIELAMDLVAVLDVCIAHLAGLGALEFDVMIGAKPLQHGIEALTRPGKQVTKMGDGDPIVTPSDARIGRVKLLTLGLRLEESGQLLLVIEPGAQGVSHGRVA
jgi:hypothetical protein